ncbi:hypothetical protein JQC91_16045 [Jannaschia sp. Os4]|uniref:hypothetical protein n=1 Tax=Jannaschia sp. Os4 TaxID=2807617 RepID=UPI00193982DB|nr:hypothetical protein [Jannaschia sp. Os4]MBM2577819.1 hypothetical protein [Jannaschia sp. Os4]
MDGSPPPPPPRPDRTDRAAPDPARVRRAARDLSEGIETRAERVRRIGRLADLGRRVMRRVHVESDGMTHAVAGLEGEARSMVGGAMDLRDALIEVDDAIRELRRAREAFVADIEESAKTAGEMTRTARAMRLLSFGATVEAARAGDAAAGFAVVAARMQEMSAACEARATEFQEASARIRRDVAAFGRRAGGMGAEISALPGMAAGLRDVAGRMADRCADVQAERRLVAGRLRQIDGAIEEVRQEMGEMRRLGQGAQGAVKAILAACGPEDGDGMPGDAPPDA